MGRTALIRVLIADDHALVRAGLAALLRGLVDVEVVGQAGDGAEALDLARRLMPDVVVVDISMKIMNGFEATQQIVKLSPAPKVIMLSMHTDRAFVERAVAAGASGYLIKDSAEQELELALRNVMRGQVYMSAALSCGLVEAFLRQGSARSSDRPLTQRQTEVLKRLAEGESTKEIAYALGLSAKTVEAHRARIHERLGIRDLAGLIRYAIRTGLTPPES